jgi:hypothetical protein
MSVVPFSRAVMAVAPVFFTVKNKIMSKYERSVVCVVVSDMHLDIRDNCSVV